MAFRQMFMLITTLCLIYSKTSGYSKIYCDLSELVSALAEIHSRRWPQNFCVFGCTSREGALKRLRYLELLRLDTVPAQSEPEEEIKVQFCSLAFGGRGCGIVAKLCKGKRSKKLKLAKASRLRLFESFEYDQTLGFPGEGWSRFQMGTWNTRSLTRERFDYCKNLGYDVLAITELWRNQGKYQTKSKQFIVSEPIVVQSGYRKGQKRFPTDRAAGVGILLSTRMQKKVHSFGSQGERICWVRLQGPVCNLFVIAVYLPHRGRVAPSQDQTLQDLQSVLDNIPARDCMCILGDFNEQVEANLEGITGNWTGGEPSANADKIAAVLRLNKLVAINTMFQPRQGQTTHTFLQTKRDEGGADASNDRGLYVGQQVRVKYKGRGVQGVVKAAKWSAQNPTWVVRFEDGYVANYGEKALKTNIGFCRK